MAGEEPGQPIERLTLAEIRERDTVLEAEAARSPFRLKPGTISGNDVAVVGTDGFLFICCAGNRWEQQYLGKLKIPPGWIEAWSAMLIRRRDEAARRGLTLMNLVVPEKQVVLPEQRWLTPLPDAENRPLRHLQRALAENGLLDYAADALVEAKAFAPAYFRHNSHWTASGCCHAMRRLLRDKGIADIPDTQRFGYRPTMIAQDLTPHMFETPPLERTALLDISGSYLSEYRAYATTGRHTGSRYAVHNPDAPDPRRIMIFGDSFSLDAGISAFMTAVFRDTIFIWSKDVLWDEVDAHEPDILLWESAERFIATVPQS